ncbi:MAG: MarR family transcriptional regulator [Solirubrobacteraceae bacterium]
MGLNHTEARLLRMLDEEGGAATQDALSRRLAVDRSNAGRAFKRLEQAGCRPIAGRSCVVAPVGHPSRRWSRTAPSSSAAAVYPAKISAFSAWVNAIASSSGVEKSETMPSRLDGSEMEEMVGEILPDLSPEAYPHLLELTMEHVLLPGYSYGLEFGLGLVLDGLQAAARG